MPRINIEEKFFHDPRIQILGNKLGNLDTAYGIMLRLFRLAQDYYREDVDIPDELIDMAFPKDHLIECKLIEKTESGYYVKGSNSYFDWINQRVEAGRKGGVASARKRKQNQAAASIRLSKPNPKSNTKSKSNTKPNTKPNTKSNTKENTSTKVDALSDKSDKDTKKKIDPELNKKTQLIIALYARLFKSKYDESPEIDPKIVGTVRYLIKKYSLNLINQYLEAYFKMDNTFFEKVGYDIFTFKRSINQIKLHIKGKGIENKLPKKYEGLKAFMEDEDVKKGSICTGDDNVSVGNSEP